MRYRKAIVYTGKRVGLSLRGQKDAFLYKGGQVSVDPRRDVVDFSDRNTPEERVGAGQF